VSEKLKTVAEVVKTIPDGSHIALGGFAIARNNINVAHELIRQQKKNLTLSQSVVGLETDLLVGAGLVSRLIMGGGSLDRFGPVHCVNRAREASRDFAHDYSSLSITFLQRITLQSPRPRRQQRHHHGCRHRYDCGRWWRRHDCHERVPHRCRQD